MAEYFVRTDNGSDDNNGTDYGSAFKTIAKAASVYQDNDVINIYSGIYLESNIDTNSKNYTAIKGHGKVVIECSGASYAFSSPGIQTYFSGLDIRNPGLAFASTGDYQDASFFDCVLSCTGQYYQTGCTSGIAPGRWGDTQLANCKLYGLSSTSCGSYGTKRMFSCVIEKCLSYFDFAYYNCAGDNSAVYGEYDGINSTTPGQEPPYSDIVDPANPDLSYSDGIDPADPELAARFEFYMQNGVYGGIIGNIDTDTVSWPSVMHGAAYERNLGSTSHYGEGAWENYEAYYNTSWQDIDIAAGSNDELNFEEIEGVELTAVIAEKPYTSGEELATAIKDALELASTNSVVYDVLFGSNKRISIDSGFGFLTLKCNSGTSSFTAYQSIGFDAASDRTGTTFYAGDSALTVGASVWSEAGAVPATVSDETRSIGIDSSFALNSTNCHAVSPVKDCKVPMLFKGFSCGIISAGAGAVDSTGGTGTRTARVRASNTAFGMHDDKETTQLDWTDVELGMVDPLITRPYKYWQYCLVLRTNAV